MHMTFVQEIPSFLETCRGLLFWLDYSSRVDYMRASSACAFN